MYGCKSAQMLLLTATGSYSFSRVLWNIETALTSYLQQGGARGNLMGAHDQTQAEVAMYEVATREVNRSNGYHRSDNIFLAIPFLQKNY
jgi:hypothetical protein